MTRKKFLVFGAPSIERPEIEEVTRTLESGWIGTGPRVAQFEREFSSYRGGTFFPVAVNSCTAALHVSMLAADLKPGDEVITTPLTFCATVNAIVHAGLTPVMADVDPVTMNIDPDQIAAKISPRTRAILPVHFAGRPCNMQDIMALSAEHGLVVIEDCAHAIEAHYQNRPVGTFGDFSCFSFYVTKNITTAEGGMILAKSSEDAGRCKILALHGMSKDAWSRFGDRGYKHYQVVECGFKYNMMDIQAAIGLHQLGRIEGYWRRREAIWGRYMQRLAHLPLGLPAPPEVDTKHAYHLFTVLVDPARVGVDRDHVLEHLTSRNIGVGVHYVSIPEHPYYQKRFGWKPEDCPNALRIGRQTLSLPLSANLQDEDVDDVISAVESVFEKF